MSMFFFKWDYAPWEFVAAGATGSGANPTAALPSGWIVGDLLIILGATETSNISDPAGWDIRLASAGANPRMGVWTKIATSGETNVAITAANIATRVRMVAYRYLASTPLDVAGTDVESSAGTTIATTTLTTTVTNDLVVSFFASDSFTSTWTAPASTNVRVNVQSNAANCGLLIVDENKATAGSTTARTATSSSSGNPRESFALSFKEIP